MKRHSTLSNEFWLLKRMVRYDKRYPLFLLASIAAKLALPFLSALHLELLILLPYLPRAGITSMYHHAL